MLRIARIIPVARANPQGSPVVRGMGWIFIRLTASRIRNVKPLLSFCAPKVVVIIASISSFSCDRALRSRCRMVMGDTPRNPAISLWSMPLR